MLFKGKCNTKSLTIPKGNPKKDRQHNGKKKGQREKQRSTKQCVVISLHRSNKICLNHNTSIMIHIHL